MSALRHVLSDILFSGKNRLQVLAKTSGGAGFGALVGEELSITDTIETVVTGSVRANNGVLSPVMEKRMVNLLIIVLRAVVAVANALIAVLELIRELID
ncbi:hypothetical protein QO964_004451 [Salmonella enterica]|nr:hypothetical protein [Salmonella enterica subsp. enterica serovar Infantis]EJA5721353.1 hypothetical protein [Salmonella enterica]EJA5745162.1 hypothetical protein [Salmonella enterica]EJF6275541.1 hypothetical protein [Salmonella enterica]EJX4364475.1 hypothetical protein [Salmonella enterica]